ncbi:MAG: carboxypeptidase regulatory-like domain-containing protein, partial [Candidatus Kapaibacterium sp.]
MLHRAAPFVLTIIIALSITGCTGNTGPAGPSLSGSMTGFVALYQSDGSRAPDQSGVTVSIQSTSLSTTTDSTGKWTISDLNTGTYTVTYTKQGYGMSEQQGLQFVGGGGTDYIGNITMAQPPDFSVSMDSISLDTTYYYPFIYYWASMNFSSSGEPEDNSTFLIVVGKDSTLNPSDPAGYLYSTLGGWNGRNPSYAYCYLSNLESVGFK